MSILSITLSFLIGTSGIAVQDPGPTRVYDSEKNITTVSITPVQLSGEKEEYLSVHVASSFNYAGRAFKSPETYRFEIRSVVKGRKLNSDLYVVFVIDGETIHLGSNRWAIRNPIPGRRAIGEVIVMQMHREMFQKLTSAKHAAIKMGGVTFELNDAHQTALRQLSQIAD